MNGQKTGCQTGYHLSRRGLLTGAGSAFAASLLPFKVNAQSSARVVVVGGGWGGISAARNLKTLMPDAQVTLVEPNDRFMSCPMSIHYIVGQRSASSLIFEFTALSKVGVRHLKDYAQTIDRDARVVVTKTETLPYDYLVVSPGIEYMEDAIPGFREHRDQLPVGFRAFEQQAVKAALDAYQGGNIVLSVPTMPFRCPIGPYERAAMFADWMNRNNKPGKVILLDQNPDVPIGKPIIDGVYTKLYKDRIEHQKGITFNSVNAQTKTIETNAGKLTYGMASLVPPQQAPALIRDAGLGGRWAKVKFPTFQSAMDDRVYVIGDSVASKLPKSGHLAFETGIRVAKHIANRVAGKDEGKDQSSMPSAICFASFNTQVSMGVTVTSEWDDFLREIKRKPMVNKPSAQVTVTANEWSKSIWEQLLG